MKRLSTKPTTLLAATAMAFVVALGPVQADDSDFSSGNNVGSMPTLSGDEDFGAAREVQGWYVSGERNAVLNAVHDAYTAGNGVTLIVVDTFDQDIRIEFRGASTALIHESALLEGGIEFGLIAGEQAPMKFALELAGTIGPVGTIGADSCLTVPFERLSDSGTLDAGLVLHTLQIGGERSSMTLVSANGLLTVTQQ